MREKFIVLIRNIRRRKVFSIIIFLLSLFATTFLVTAIGTVTNVKGLYDKSYDKTKSGDVFLGFVGDAYSDSYEEHFTNMEEVDLVTKEDNLLGLFYITEEESLNTIISTYKGKHNYSIDVEKEDDFKLKENEALVPSYFRDAYSLNFGDTISYVAGNIVLEFSIAGFFEDPIFRSPLYETKRMLISDTYFNELLNNHKENQLQPFYLLNINLKEEYRGSDFSKNTTKIIDSFDKGTVSVFALDRTFMTTVRLMVPRIISLVLIVFAVFLVIILSIVLRYTILATIETDFKSFGIMKALGFQAKDIIQIFALQFSLIAFAGSAVGSIIAFLIIPTIGKLLLASSGIWWSGTVNYRLILLIIGILLLYVLINVYISARKIKRIKPMEAILQGRSNHNKIGKGISIEKGILVKLPLTIKLAIKQLTMNLSQYTTLIVLCVILTFMISTVFGLNSTFSDTSKVSNLLGFPVYDVRIEVNDSDIMTDAKMNDVLKEIENEYRPEFIIGEDSKKIEIDNTTVLLVISTFYNTGGVVEGRVPTKDNEIMITDGIRKLINKDLGDTVKLSLSKNSEETKEFQIVGINNNVIELGKNISILSSGYQRFDNEYSPQRFYMKLKDSSRLDEKIIDLKEKYGSESSGLNISNARIGVTKTIDLIQNALNAASYAIVVISLFLIVLIIILIALVVIAREIMNVSIMKSIGFSSWQTRVMLCLRFIFVSLVGTLIGVFANSLVNERLINALFKIASISKVPTGVTISVYLTSIIFVLGTTIISTWLISGVMKNINIRLLIQE